MRSSCMGACRNFRRGEGGGNPKKAPNLEKKAPHKEIKEAKRPPHGEKAPPPRRKKRQKVPPQRGNFQNISWGPSAHCCPLWAPMSP